MPLVQLNDNQARHVRTAIALLLDEFSELAKGLPPGPAAFTVVAQVEEVQRRARALLEQLGLPLPQRPPPRQRVACLYGDLARPPPRPPLSQSGGVRRRAARPRDPAGCRPR